MVLSLFKKERIGYSHSVDLNSLGKALLGSQGLKVLHQEFNQELNDGRNMSSFTEIVAQLIPWRIHGVDSVYVRLKTSGYDGNLRRLGKPARFKTGQRTLTQRIRFQNSIYQGGNRVCETEDLLKSLEAVDYYMICDIANPRQWLYWLVESNLLLEEIHAGRLTPFGWTRKVFYEFLKQRKYAV